MKGSKDIQNKNIRGREQTSVGIRRHVGTTKNYEELVRYVQGGKTPLTIKVEGNNIGKQEQLEESSQQMINMKNFKSIEKNAMKKREKLEDSSQTMIEMKSSKVVEERLKGIEKRKMYF